MKAEVILFTIMLIAMCYVVFEIVDKILSHTRLRPYGALFGILSALALIGVAATAIVSHRDVLYACVKGAGWPV